MSRSYHITRKEAARRLVMEGEAGALQAYAEKQSLKMAVKTFRGVYGLIHPSSKEPNELTGSVAFRAMKVATKGLCKTAAQIVADRDQVSADTPCP